jgi:lysozyme family protein
MNFDLAFDKLINHERGYVNDRRDNGRETKFGISKKAYPGEDIAGMTLDRARAIYLRDYWGPAGCDAVQDGAKFSLFDIAVNCGVKQAVRFLQRATGETVDGVLGPRTLQAAQAMPAARLAARLEGERLKLWAEHSDFPAFGRGWVRRAATNLKEL